MRTIGIGKVSHEPGCGAAPAIIGGPVFRDVSAMFESLTQRLSGTIDRLRGRGRLTEENIREATREVRIALLEADVALDRKSTRLNSSHVKISYAVFCLKKKI